MCNPPVLVRKADPAYEIPNYTSVMHPRSSLAGEHSLELGWENDKTPQSERSLADQVPHRYCTRRRHEIIADSVTYEIQRYAIIVLHERDEYSEAVEERTEAERSASYPTPDDELVGVVEEISDQLALDETSSSRNSSEF